VNQDRPIPDGPYCSRRAFLARTAKAGAAIAGVAAGGYLLTGRDTGSDTARAAALRDFSIADARGEMAIVTGANRVKTVRRALAALGGVQRFVSRGDRVVVKVNAAFATPPSLGATAHPDLVGEVVRLCLAAGAAEVVVTDNPINDPVSCFELSGIGPAARRAGAKVLLPREALFRPYTLPDGGIITHWPVLYEPLAGATKVIGIAPVKNHFRAGASMSMKNWYGLLGGRRNRLHQDIHNTIKELAMMVRPTLVVLDGTRTMMTNGPTGGSVDDLKATNTMIVSTDQVAADAYAATLLDLAPGELPYLAKAERAGVGAAAWRSIKLHRAEIG